LAVMPIKEERIRLEIKRSLLLLLAWTVWLSFITTLTLPEWLALPCVSLILVYGAISWRVAEGAFYLLIAAWIHSHFSLTPPGFYWLCMFSVFCVQKFLMTQFKVGSAVGLVSIIFIGAIGVELLQMTLFWQLHDVSLWSFMLLGSVLTSALAQTLLGALVSPLFMRMVTKT
jgi:hypothetical protein